MKSKQKYVIYSIIFALALLIGVLIAHSVTTYNRNLKNARAIEIKKHLGTYTRFVEIVSITPEDNTVVIKTLDRDLFGEISIKANLNNDILIETQNSIFKESVLVGFSDKKILAVSDLRVGDKILAKLNTDNDGNINIGHIVLGNPLPLP